MSDQDILSQRILEVVTALVEREMESIHLRLDHLDAVLDLLLVRSGGVPQKYTVLTDAGSTEVMLLRKEN